jgi:hypothetical protein
VRAVVSKRGVDDGNQKGGGFLQPAQESHYHYSIRRRDVQRFLFFFLLLLPLARIFLIFTPFRPKIEGTS